MFNPVPAKALPVYMQVVELLSRQIKAGYWREGERLPTEAELATLLNVAVGTLRKSLALLSDQGVLERVQGSGTYIKRVDASKRIYELFRLELLNGPGLPTAYILNVEKLKKPKYVPKLDSRGGKDAWCVKRLRFLSQKPVALEEIWFSSDYSEALQAEELGDSMYLFYQERFGICIARAEDFISVAKTPDWAPKYGPLKSGDCAGFIERISKNIDNQVVEYSRTWFDPNSCRYSSRLS